MSPALAEKVARQAKPIHLFHDLWPLARICMSEHYIRLLADYLAQVRRARSGPGHDERWETELDWEEAQWMLEQLRPSLVIDAEANPHALARYLRTLQRAALLQSSPTAVLVAALDGAPEHRHDCFRKSRNNGRHPEVPVRKKDDEFYVQCYHALALFDVVPIDQTGGDAPVPGVRAREACRDFEDAYVGVCVASGTRMAPVAAALHLHRALAQYNDEQSAHWTKRLNARVSIATTWEAAVAALPRTWRGQTRVDPAIWAECTDEEKELMLAADVRVGDVLVAEQAAEALAEQRPASDTQSVVSGALV